VVIFGWGRGSSKDKGEVAPLTCPNCHNTVFLHDVESKQQFSLYFVPVVKYGGDRYLLCPVCGRGIQVLPGQKAAVDRMRSLTAQFRLRGVTEETYRSEVGRFWQLLGVQSGPALPAPRPNPAVAPLPALPAAPPTLPAATQPGASPAGAELAAHLTDLARLRAEGSLTEEEFAEAKRRLLGI
jgi:zinc-ribbon family/Short C-terminal domain